MSPIISLGGCGNGPAGGVGAGLVRGISWSKVFVSFCLQKEKKVFIFRSPMAEQFGNY
jgi:hypothetical protein